MYSLSSPIRTRQAEHLHTRLAMRRLFAVAGLMLRKAVSRLHHPPMCSLRTGNRTSSDAAMVVPTPFHRRERKAGSGTTNPGVA